MLLTVTVEHIDPRRRRHGRYNAAATAPLVAMVDVGTVRNEYCHAVNIATFYGAVEGRDFCWRAHVGGCAVGEEG